jgi:hypothetical protein
MGDEGRGTREGRLERNILTEVHTAPFMRSTQQPEGALPVHETLPELLLRVVDRTASGWLVLLMVGGTAATLVTWWFLPRLWPLLFPSLVAVSFGAWALLTQEAKRLAGSASVPPLLRAARAVAATVASIATFCSILALFVLALGDSWSH